MANQEQFDTLAQGVVAWNVWRRDHAEAIIDLSGADLMGRDLSAVNFQGGDLRRANLYQANLSNADLRGADLREASFMDAKMSGAHLDGAHLRKAVFHRAELPFATFFKANAAEADFLSATLAGADFSEAILDDATLGQTVLSCANLGKASLRRTDLSSALMLNVDLRGAHLEQCRVFGVSAWNINGEGSVQKDLIITRESEARVEVDDLEIAQFVYLLLNNTKIRSVIDTVGKKAVLILGRFTRERKAVLDAIRDAIRARGYVPLLFDFEGPEKLDLTETIRLLAHLARFIIADLTEPSSLPKELETIVPLLAVPVQPLLEGKDREYAMFRDYWKYPWVLAVYRYEGLPNLLASLDSSIIEPAKRAAAELEERRRQAMGCDQR